MTTGLLTKYIEADIKRYVEPSRIGVAKGDPIGFSKPKHAAVMYSLTNMPLKEIAKRAGCSYATLLVWRTEEQFQAKIKDIGGRFAFSFWIMLDSIQEAIKDLREEEGPESESIKKLVSHFNDAGMYSDQLALAIVKESPSSVDEFDRMIVLSMFEEQLCKADRTYTDTFKRFRIESKRQAYASICKLMEKDSLDANEMQYVRHYLAKYPPD